MEMDRMNRQKFYHSQNIDLRKEIRQIDLRLAQGENMNSHCSFLVVGPAKVGKTTFLKTLQFALNGSQGWGMCPKGPIMTVQIKKGAKWQVEGVKELRQVNQKFGVQGIELLSEEKPGLRYKRALQYVQGSAGHCLLQSSQVDLRVKAKVCLILINSAMDVSNDEMTYLKFLRTDLVERGVKTYLVLIGSFDRSGESWKKIESRIALLSNQLEIKRDDVICMDIYHFQEPGNQNGNSKIVLKQSHFTSNSKIENNEEINFYALQLVLKIARESERTAKKRTVKNNGWLCNWN